MTQGSPTILTSRKKMAEVDFVLEILEDLKKAAEMAEKNEKNRDKPKEN